VTLDPDSEILPLIGSKEGIMHICMTYLNNGDEVLVPNPGYPTYRSAVKLSGGKCVEYKLTEKNNYEPDFEALGKIAARRKRVKMIFVNYPHMPSGQQASIELFGKIVAFGREHRVLVVHDNPYSFILNSNPLSLLSVPGAKECVVELNSLSKSHNMAGWRVGMLCGPADKINDILKFKSNMDSGMFQPVQMAAAKALRLGSDWYESVNTVYRARREKVFELLDMLKCKYSKQQAGLFVWARVPAEYKDGYQLSDKILYDSNVFITPGGIFGTAGEKYIRVSLCGAIERFDEAMKRISVKP
jgi:aspartate/methionine/tyrosine aminotransferase